MGRNGYRMVLPLAGNEAIGFSFVPAEVVVMTELIVGLTFAAIGATTAEWRVILIPGFTATAYIALGSLAPAYQYDLSFLTLCAVAGTMAAVGVLARRFFFAS